MRENKREKCTCHHAYDEIKLLVYRSTSRDGWLSTQHGVLLVTAFLIHTTMVVKVTIMQQGRQLILVAFLIHIGPNEGQQKRKSPAVRSLGKEH